VSAAASPGVCAFAPIGKTLGTAHAVIVQRRPIRPRNARLELLSGDIITASQSTRHFRRAFVFRIASA
jgi:hypothetical protein